VDINVVKKSSKTILVWQQLEVVCYMSMFLFYVSMLIIGIVIIIKDQNPNIPN
jgi:hypothetical protein